MLILEHTCTMILQQFSWKNTASVIPASLTLLKTDN